MNLRPLLAASLLALAIFAGAPASADPVPPAALATVDQLLAAINADDLAGVAATYSVEPTIVDEFAPFQWSGVDASKKWFKDFRALAVASGISKVHVARHAPRYFHRDGHFGYLTVPVDYTYSLKGSPVTERGAFVLSLYEMEGLGWKIRASAWYLINNSVEPPLGAGLK